MWANVGKSLNCVIAMVDKLLEKDNSGNTKEGETDPSTADCKHAGSKQPFGVIFVVAVFFPFFLNNH